MRPIYMAHFWGCRSVLSRLNEHLSLNKITDRSLANGRAPDTRHEWRGSGAQYAHDVERACERMSDPLAARRGVGGRVGRGPAGGPQALLQWGFYWR